MQIEQDDDNRAAKLKALAGSGLASPGSLRWASLPLEECLAAARVLCADEVLGAHGRSQLI